MISGFKNDTATFFSEEQTGTEEDPYGETEPIYEWVAQYSDVPVRAEQQSAEYVREVYGEWPQEVYRLFAEPRDIGTVSNGSYELGVAADDRVELSGVTGRYSIHSPNLQRLDSEVPEYVQLEATKVDA